jgi:hypothetical protein
MPYCRQGADSRLAIGVRPIMTASQNAFTQRILLALLTEQAELAAMPVIVIERNNEGQPNWIGYPAARAAIEETIRVLIRSLANAHGIALSYPMG